MRSEAESVDQDMNSEEEVDSLRFQLTELFPFLDDPQNTEIVINKPSEVLVENRNGWVTHNVPAITHKWCEDLARLIANRTKQTIKRESPMLSATLPTGERIQVVIAPAVTAGTTSVTIRKPNSFVKPFKDFIADGTFENARLVQSILLNEEERRTLEADLPDEDKQLLELLRKKDYEAFIRLAVLERKNMVISGSTGAGKTTLSNAILEFLPPDERIITAEDTPEIRLPPGLNVVNMFYSKGGQGVAKVTPKDIFESCLRMRPDRVLPAELRGDETFYFVQNVLNSGHPGTLTTVHSNSTKLCFLRLSMMIKSSEEGRGLDREDILEMLYQLIDVVIQIKKVRIGGQAKRLVTEIYYDPAFARKQMG